MTKPIFGRVILPERTWPFFIDLLIFVLFVILGIGGVMLMHLSIGQSTAGLGIPKMLVYAALPFGSVMMLVELTISYCTRIRAKG